MDEFYNLWVLLTQCLRSVSLDAEPDREFECIIYWESALGKKAMKESR